MFDRCSSREATSTYLGNVAALEKRLVEFHQTMVAYFLRRFFGPWRPGAAGYHWGNIRRILTNNRKIGRK
jgi:hypothetical protein